MLGAKKPFTKKKALLWVGIGIAVCILLILLRWTAGDTDVSTTAGREKFLNSFGWEIDCSTEEYRTVIIPTDLGGVMEDYARMQSEQGYDLAKYSGKPCEQYSYEVTNYPNYDGIVLATLYIHGKNIVAADIHSAAINGFMHGLNAGQ